MSSIHSRLFVVSAIVLVGHIVAGPPSDRMTASAKSDARTSFQDRVEEYVRLRRQIAERLQAGELAGDGTDASVRIALARAIGRARRNARAGDIFGPDVAARVQQVVWTDMTNRAAWERHAILSEVPVAPGARVNDVYPDDAPLATTPPLLLRQLSPLPPELHYRFLEDAMILLDVDAGLIVDVIPDVLGRRIRPAMSPSVSGRLDR